MQDYTVQGRAAPNPIYEHRSTPNHGLSKGSKWQQVQDFEAQLWEPLPPPPRPPVLGVGLVSSSAVVEDHYRHLRER